MTQKEQFLLGQIDGKVDGIIDRLDKMNGTLIEHSKKINILETFRDNLQGRMSIIGAVAGFIGAVITIFINYLTKQ